MEEITHIYAIYCKDESGVTLLKKAYKSKSQAYSYAVNKITTLVNIINEDYKKNSETHILPISAQVIYTIFMMKSGNDLEQYEYFKENYVKFFKYVSHKPVMFYVSTLELI
jgi:hypothetical protein